MDAVTTPATNITVRPWTGLNISRSLRVHEGAIVADLYLGASCQTQEFVGTSEGVPLKPVAQTGMGQVAVGIPQDQLMAVFNQPTPEGMTVLQFLDQELSRLAKAEIAKAEAAKAALP